MTPEKCMSMMLKTMAKIAEADQAAPVHDCVLSVSDRAPRPPRRRRHRRRAAAPPRRTTPRAPRRAAAAHCAAHLPSARRPQHTPLRSTWAALRLPVRAASPPDAPPHPLAAGARLLHASGAARHARCRQDRRVRPTFYLPY